MQSWSTKKLSQVGREVMIKLELQATPTYSMSCFKLPEMFLKEVKGLVGAFFWNQEGGKTIHWLAWSKIYQIKKRDGLRMHSLKEFNVALLRKQAWRISKATDSLVHRASCHWRTGDDPSSEIAATPWILWHTMFRLVLPSQSLDADATVNVLLDDGGGWNEEMVRSKFGPFMLSGFFLHADGVSTTKKGTILVLLVGFVP
ncbi:UNVERIFIED_CONTAM: hypothetical protein Sradi_5249500 [Sesamum radiatum]|uniref:Uncharacterized protein n=1 Tax=Sesamum radiatum TaxID=300843 RepID=A0AAW2LL56_SESRA